MSVNLALPLLWNDVYEKGVKSGDRSGAFAASIIDGIAEAGSFGASYGAKVALQGTPLSWRPLDLKCSNNPRFDADCGTSEEFFGDPSGHSWNAWTTVGILLAHRWWDSENPASGQEILLSAGLGLATMAQRMLGSYHYASQTLLGSAGGLAFGIAVPGIARAAGIGYNHWNKVDKKLSYTLTPTVTPHPHGLSVGATISF